jgi:hypothetical protein
MCVTTLLGNNEQYITARYRKPCRKWERRYLVLEK